MLLRLAPLLFVILWSTGFIASKVAGEHAEPFTLLLVRFALTFALLMGWAVWTRIDWPTRPALIHAAVTGILIHTAYIGGVLWALRLGMPSGVVAAVVCLQPVLTGILAGPLLGERPGRQHWLGLAVGLAGVLMVLAPKLAAVSPAGALGPLSVVMVLAALIGITLGTINQKRHGATGDLIGLTIAQYAGATAVAGMIALATEDMAIAWTAEFTLALAWLVLVLSIGAIGLLMLLIRASAVSSVTGLFYLVPAVTALMAAAMFGETLSIVQLAGMALVMAAVAVLRPAAMPPGGQRPHQE
ncbi:MAG: EamA family transporter [Hyphomicrobiaceae bacterium]|nr:EamA family transporter [Hyphomicrobiaceae bacterium]